jgi:hypothetical protein
MFTFKGSPHKKGEIEKKGGTEIKLNIQNAATVKILTSIKTRSIGFKMYYNSAGIFLTRTQISF